VRRSFNLIKSVGIALIIYITFNGVLLSQTGNRYEFESAYI